MLACAGEDPKCIKKPFVCAATADDRITQFQQRLGETVQTILRDQKRKEPTGKHGRKNDDSTEGSREVPSDYTGGVNRPLI